MKRTSLWRNNKQKKVKYKMPPKAIQPLNVADLKNNAKGVIGWEQSYSVNCANDLGSTK